MLEQAIPKNRVERNTWIQVHRNENWDEVYFAGAQKSGRTWIGPDVIASEFEKGTTQKNSYLALIFNGENGELRKVAIPCEKLERELYDDIIKKYDSGKNEFKDWLLLHPGKIKKTISKKGTTTYAFFPGWGFNVPRQGASKDLLPVFAALQKNQPVNIVSFDLIEMEGLPGYQLIPRSDNEIFSSIRSGELGISKVKMTLKKCFRLHYLHSKASALNSEAGKQHEEAEGYLLNVARLPEIGELDLNALERGGDDDATVNRSESLEKLGQERLPHKRTFGSLKGTVREAVAEFLDSLKNDDELEELRSILLNPEKYRTESSTKRVREEKSGADNANDGKLSYTIDGGKKRKISYRKEIYMDEKTIVGIRMRFDELLNNAPFADKEGSKLNVADEDKFINNLQQVTRRRFEPDLSSLKGTVADQMNNDRDCVDNFVQIRSVQKLISHLGGTVFSDAVANTAQDVIKGAYEKARGRVVSIHNRDKLRPEEQDETNRILALSGPAFREALDKAAPRGSAKNVASTNWRGR